MSWACAVIEITDEAMEILRRYAMGTICTSRPGRIHDATKIIGEVVYERDDEGSFADDFPHDDMRWPVSCICRYIFTENDQYQHGFKRLYENSEWLGFIEDAPVGCMWDASWLGDTWVGPDGLHLTIKLPDGSEWIIDGPASNGPGWQRTGIPPRITAQPSILSPGYHGWLTDGVLSDDLEGREYGV